MENAFFYHVYNLEEAREEAFANLAEAEDIFYRYFSADNKHYIFAYSSSEIDFGLVNSILEPIQNLDRRERKIRSLRGYILYADEIMATAETKEVLKTNMEWFFWERALNAIAQNKTKGLEAVIYQEPRINPHPLHSTAIIRSAKARTISQKTGENPFKKLSEIPNDTLEIIISKGFKLQDEQKISSLKNYFESTEENCVFKSHGYSIKYDSIRKRPMFRDIRDQGSK